MKKLILLSILLIALAVSASAQYTSAYVKPITVKPTIAQLPPTTVYVPPSGDCYDVCSRECVSQQISSDKCAVMCREKCYQPTPVQEDCPTMCKKLSAQGIEVVIRCMHDRCKEDCESSCRMMYGNQAQNCVEKLCRPQTPPETCEQGCGRRLDECLKTTVGMNIESIRAACAKLHIECMQEQCGKPETCEQGCDKDYKVCLEKTVGLNAEGIRMACEKFRNECVQQCGKPETCEDGCDREHKICLDKTVGFNAEGIRAACDGNRKNCIIQCAPKPVSCEGRCESIMDDCKANNVDLKSCQLKIDACKRQCKQPECPDYNCEMSCVKEYHGCAEGDCDGALSQCIDGCFGPEDPQAALRCRKDCRTGKIECLDRISSTDPFVRRTQASQCGFINGFCMQACPPLPPDWVPPPLSCNDECSEEWIQCMSDGRDKGLCLLGSGSCRSDCPESIEPGGQIVEQAPEVPEDSSAPSSKAPSPKDMAGLNPQPDPPSAQGKPQDLVGLNPQPEPPSLWKRFLGWFGG